MSGSCPSCGFKWQSDSLEQAGGRCPRCGAGGQTSSMTPIYGALLGLVALLHVAIGAAAWSMPAGPWLVGAGMVMLVACAAVMFRAARS